MKYLFIVQGEGRGHLTQAISLSQMLRRHGHEVVEVLVGKSSNREIPAFFLEKIPAAAENGNARTAFGGCVGSQQSWESCWENPPKTGRSLKEL